jgi:Domain of unknown function (DUF927)
MRLKAQILRGSSLSKLIATQSPDDIEVEPDRTGFIDKRTFVTFSEIISFDGSVKSRRVLGKHEPDCFDDIKGTPEGTRRVLKLARHSTYLSWTIGVALVAPLPSYVKLFRPEEAHDQAVVSENCVFNLWGESGSGKTDALKTAMSLVGSPERVGIFDFTRRGLEEMANRSNDLPLVIDDTEYIEDPGSVVKAFKSIVHKVPGGRSKVISDGVDGPRFQQLRWSTFGLSSSPRPISVLAEEAGWTMSEGHKVRLPDIAVPGPKSGGIFDRTPGNRGERAAKSIELIKELERGYLNNHGHVFQAWLLYLMRKDRTRKIFALVQRFVDRVCISKQGWEVRFARKFGIVYAAMILGISAGILPWTREFAFSVAKRCYRNAQKSASGEQRSRDVLHGLQRLIDDHGIDVALNQRKPIDLPNDPFVLRYRKKGRRKYGLLDATLQDLCGSTKAKTALTDALAEAGILSGGHGHAGTRQERIPIIKDGRMTKKPRLWVIDAKRFEKRLKRASR